MEPEALTAEWPQIRLQTANMRAGWRPQHQIGWAIVVRWHLSPRGERYGKFWPLCGELNSESRGLGHRTAARNDGEVCSADVEVGALRGPRR